jgi:hypothetical protein
MNPAQRAVLRRAMRRTARRRSAEVGGTTINIRQVVARGDDPLPLVRSRAAGLARKDVLVVLAPFMPAHLIEQLTSEGFAVTLEHRDDGAWSVGIRCP